MNGKTLDSNGLDYDAIEAAVMETPRGRWFLSEFLRRHQSRQTERLLESIHRLERALEVNAPVAPRIRAAMAGTAAQIGSQIANTPMSLPEVARLLSEEAAAIADALAEAAATLDNDHKGERSPASRLHELAERQDLLAGHLAVLARGLAEVAAICGEPEPMDMDVPDIPADALAWFAGHDELFEAAEPAPSIAAPAAALSPEKAPQETDAETAADDAEAVDRSSAASSESGRDGHLTVLITPGGIETSAQGRIDGVDLPESDPSPVGAGSAEAKEAAPDASRREDAAGSARSGASKPPRRSRIIIRHKSSSDEVDIPFVQEGKS